MTSKSDLLLEIQEMLGVAINPRLSTRDEASDIYEAYLFALIVRAAELEGGRIEYRSVSGGKPTEFVFRKSPGYIDSIRQPYSFARIDFGAQSRPLEAHLGVRVSGKSRVLHECDVLVLPEAEAIRCRSRGLAPRSHTLLLAVEAKFYASSLPLGEARGFVGLRTDFSVNSAALRQMSKARKRLDFSMLGPPITRSSLFREQQQSIASSLALGPCSPPTNEADMSGLTVANQRRREPGRHHAE